MINPSPQDIGRDVHFCRVGEAATGRLTGFGPHYCYVEVLGFSTPVRREDLDWAGPRPAPGESDREKAARSRFEAEGFTIEVAAAHQWLIDGFSFWPEIGMWRRPDGSGGPSGIASLIEALRQARAKPQKPPSDAA